MPCRSSHHPLLYWALSSWERRKRERKRPVMQATNTKLKDINFGVTERGRSCERRRDECVWFPGMHAGLGNDLLVRGGLFYFLLKWLLDMFFFFLGTSLKLSNNTQYAVKWALCVETAAGLRAMGPFSIFYPQQVHLPSLHCWFIFVWVFSYSWPTALGCVFACFHIKKHFVFLTQQPRIPQSRSA